MNSYIDKFRYELKVPFEYSSGGEGVKAKHLTVYAPNNKVIDYTSTLETLIAKGANSVFSKENISQEQIEEARKSKDEDKEESLEDKIDTVIALFKASNQYGEAIKAFKKILSYQYGGRATCSIDDTQAMTLDLFDSMSIVDTREALGMYVVNFLMFSR